MTTKELDSFYSLWLCLGLVKNLIIFIHSCMLVSWDKVTISFASVLSFSCLNSEALFISKFIFCSTPHSLRHSREQLWVVMGRCLEMVLLHSACTLSGFIEHGKYSLARGRWTFKPHSLMSLPFISKNTSCIPYLVC